MIRDYFLMALKNLKKEKLRSFLTLVGILISIATIFVLISVSLGLENAVNEQFRLLGTDKIFIQPKGQLAGPGTGGAVTFTKTDVETIKKINGVKKVTFWTAASIKIEVDKEVRFGTVVGIDIDSSELFEETGAYKIDEGRFLKKGDTGSVVLGSQYKYNNLFKKPLSKGDRILLNDKKFRVRGIFEPIGNPSDDRLVFMPLEEFRQVFEIPERVDIIVVQVEDAQRIKEISSNIERKLMKKRGLDEKTIDFTILTPEELLSTFGNVLSIVTGFLVGIAAISLLVGGIGIANTMFTSVLERTKEIGVMKAIGAENKDILFIFVIESGFLGVVGGIVGVVVGIIASKLIEYVAVAQLGTTLLRAAIPFYLVTGSLVFSFLVGAISGLWPAWRAIRIKPVDALRYE